jgi:uncharacterized membrane protein YdjX (TVP38/TMEM64 family)
MPSLRTILHSPATLWFFVVVTVLTLGLAWWLLPMKQWLASFNGWVAGLGAWGVAIFAAGYVIAVVALVPTTPLTIAAGLAYGFWGFPLVLVASITGAELAFLAARHGARGRVQAYLRKRPRLKVIDQVVTRNSWKIVALIRLSPFLTFGLQNYLFGVTGVRPAAYTSASLVGIIPSTALCIYIGAAGGVMQGPSHGGIVEWTLVGAGFLFLLAITIFTARQAREKLLEAGLGDLR